MQMAWRKQGHSSSDIICAPHEGLGGQQAANLYPQVLGAKSVGIGGEEVSSIQILAEDSEINFLFVLKPWLSFD